MGKIEDRFCLGRDSENSLFCITHLGLLRWLPWKTVCFGELTEILSEVSSQRFAVIKHQKIVSLLRR
jgi:hypothetical protein